MIDSRLPPHAIDAEQGCLGCILIAPKESLATCVEQRLTADVFYDIRHVVLYSFLLELYNSGEPIDTLTLSQRLIDRQFVQQVGGLAYISTLPDVVPSAANLTYYLDIVREKYVLRRVIQVGTEMAILGYEGSNPTDLLDKVEAMVLGISQERKTNAIVPMKQLVNEAINQVELFFDRKGATLGLETGFIDFDRLTGGLQGGEVTIIAARPSTGKSSIAINIVDHVAVNLELPVGVFSLEMTKESVVLRMLCSRARVNLQNIREGFLSDRDFPKLTSAAGKLSPAPIYIDDTAGLNILQVKAGARRMVQQWGIKLLVIDYLQRIHGVSRKAANNRQIEVGEVSTGLQELAKELGIPLLVLAQLNRDMEREKGRKPRLSDLRESGAIEADADVIGMLYRPPSEDESPADDAVAVNLLIGKNRNGPTAEIPLIFLKGITRFESAAKVSADDAPQQTEWYNKEP